MTPAQADHARAVDYLEIPGTVEAPAGLTLDTPRLADGASLWRIARDSRVLDLNSSYSYLLWCRDYPSTSIVARDASGEPVGFITGYLRPNAPATLLIWQVAVDHAQRGRGLAAAMLDALARRTGRELGVTTIETTVTPDNTASNRLFAAFAERHRATVRHEVLFDSQAFPESGHQPEVLYRIGPIRVPDVAAAR
ncbi:diaminobutyrate acetyltransferase [Streptomyces sp. 3MP-14]|uniref:L-2,4-diaminobutyric acid acetyltransferase n=1 Tax=Streptomyces mimosae TaxID=2586635 RepID=A0A5N5ZQ42_9ACTN|nr:MULTISPECIES: diaminobutyrate acetyltransferase [Streptomyces]KAB8157048.1 diaminobutyrate acetyltransferase [Streptomyces mimosae]KAB8172496.1 diaminobutyrate acetyltransferase [Streptomyces sp. 3MP-14]